MTAAHHGRLESLVVVVRMGIEIHASPSRPGHSIISRGGGAIGISYKTCPIDSPSLYWTRADDYAMLKINFYK
jgi:hypothetical protein